MAFGKQENNEVSVEGGLGGASGKGDFSEIQRSGTLDAQGDHRSLPLKTGPCQGSYRPRIGLPAMTCF